MKTNKVVEASKSTIFIGNDGSQCWLEVCCGLREDGSPYCITNEQWPLDISGLGSDENALKNYIAAEVRKVAAITGAEQVSEHTMEFLPSGFTL